MYLTVKGQCHDRLALHRGRVCDKLGHLSCRKVVAFNKMPVKSVWRDISRALEALAKRCAGGCEVWRTRDAIPSLRSALEVRTARGGHLQCCERCGTAKREWEGLATDAWQMFESIDASVVMDAVGRMLARAKDKSGHDTVTVVRHKSSRAYIRGACVTRSLVSRTFAFDELARDTFKRQ